MIGSVGTFDFSFATFLLLKHSVNNNIYLNNIYCLLFSFRGSSSIQEEDIDSLAETKRQVDCLRCSIASHIHLK